MMKFFNAKRVHSVHVGIVTPEPMSVAVLAPRTRHLTPAYRARGEAGVPSAEPTLSALSNPLLRYFLATRPAFLSVTFFAALIGIASASYGGFDVANLPAIVTVVFALVAHAGINVLNDYYDELNGTDRINTERIFSFTGGSRFIQNGVLTLRQTGIFGAILLGVVIIPGLWLTQHSGPGPYS